MNQHDNSSPRQLAAHVRQIHFGGNWTTVSLKDQLAGVDWQMATHEIKEFHTIAALVYHTHYFVQVVLQVFQGQNLDAHDKFSFDHPPVHSEQDWQNLLTRVWSDAEQLAALLEQLPDSQLWEDFTAQKNGNYYRNILGIIEHSHYHLGQIVLIRKLIQQANE